jgi:hypothetical protein
MRKLVTLVSLLMLVKRERDGANPNAGKSTQTNEPRLAGKLLQRHATGSAVFKCIR